MMPTNVAARMTLAAEPDSLQGAVAAGILGRPGGARHAGGVRAAARAAQARVLDGERPSRRRRARPRDPRRGRQGCPASAIRSTGPSTRARSGSSSSPTSAVSAARTSRCARSFRDAVAEAWGKPLTLNVVDADRGGDARSRLPAEHRQGGADPRAHRRAARPSRRGAGASARVPPGGEGRGSGHVRAPTPTS